MLQTKFVTDTSFNFAMPVSLFGVQISIFVVLLLWKYIDTFLYLHEMVKKVFLVKLDNLSWNSSGNSVSQTRTALITTDMRVPLAGSNVVTQFLLRQIICYASSCTNQILHACALSQRLTCRLRSAQISFVLPQICSHQYTSITHHHHQCHYRSQG